MTVGNPYGQGLIHLGVGRIQLPPGTSTLKCALLTSAYTPNLDAHAYLSDVTSAEVASGGGYTTGGNTMTGLIWTYDSTNLRAVLAADDTVWLSATFTCRYAVVYADTGTPSTSPLLTLVDFEADRSPTADTFSIAWINGVLRLARA